METMLVDEMDLLYLIKLSEPMSQEEASCWMDKQLGSMMAQLKSMPTLF